MIWQHLLKNLASVLRSQDKLEKQTNILICPLEWGLGHAARMLPMARKLQTLNNKIFIGSGEKHLDLFRTEMDDITCISFPGFTPAYSRRFPQYLVMLFQTPRLLYHIIREHIRLKKIIREHSIDVVISDNRFGLWNKKVTSVYVTHMPLIPLPEALGFLEFTGILLHRFIIRKYTYCYIPDLPGELNLTGRLSHGISLPDNVRFIGILSRFSSSENIKQPESTEPRHNTVILSGPEPQRGILKQKIIGLFQETEPETIILEGNPCKETVMTKKGNLTFINHLRSAEMGLMLRSSRSIISRSGYTTIMDLVSLNCSALLIPTPGQTEQEYLADYLAEKGWFKKIPQSITDENVQLPATKALWPMEMILQSEVLLMDALRELSEHKHKNNQPQKSG